MTLKLEVKNGDPQTLLILWEGEVWREVAKSLFLSELRKFPKETTWDEFLSRFSLFEEKRARSYAIYLLSRRLYLASDLREKLVAKGFSRSVADSVVESCVQKGYIDDAQEIHRLVARELKKGQSAKAVYYKLRQKKGMREDLLKAALEQATPSDSEALEKWLARHAKKIDWSDRDEKNKLIAKLLRRGFSSELVFARIVNN